MSGKVSLTEKYAASLQWRGKPNFTWDLQVPGFGVWVWGPGESRAYVVQAKHKGKSYRKTLGKVSDTRLADARLEAVKFKGVVRAGLDPNAAQKAIRGAWTLSDAVDYALGTHADAQQHAEATRELNVKAYEHHTPPRWQGMKLADITRAMIVAQHKAITAGTRCSYNRATGGARRANTWLAFMSTVFTGAIREGQYAGDNPCAGIKKNPDTERDRYLSAVEIRTLWTFLQAHSNVQAAAAVQFILSTGCRPKEAFNAKWSHIDQTSGGWVKPAATNKQRKKHVVALNDKALAVLGRLNTHEFSEYVFPSPSDPSKPRSDKLKSFWRVVRKQCALADVNLYDCRHSFASWLAMGGATELEIGAQLGHADPKTTKRYVHLAQEHLRLKAGIMSEVIAQAMEPEMPLDQMPIIARKTRSGAVVTDSGWQPWPPIEPEDETGA